MSQSTSTGIDERVRALIIKADDAQRNNHLPDAFEKIRQASQLQPENPEVQRRWQALQASSGVLDLSLLLTVYAASGNDEDGRRALQALKLNQLDATAVVDVLDSLNRGEHLTSTQRDELTAAVLSTQVQAKAHVSARLASNATEVFEQMFQRGERSFRVFSLLPSDASTWTAKNVQALAQKDVFRLCVAKLMGAGVDHPERAMTAIARQLATSPESVADIIDEDVFDVVLAALDIRRDASLRSQALLAASKMLEVTKEHGEQLFAAFVTAKVAKRSNDDMIVAFSAAAALFPIAPVTAKLFLVDGFLQELVPILERNSGAAIAGVKKSRRLEQAALELLSAACIDKACRQAIDRYCSPWLQSLSSERDGQHRSLAVLVLAKLGTQTAEDITVKLSELVLRGNDESDQAIEGLAYTSLQPSIKELIAGDDQLIKRLVVALGERASVTFACLTVFANLTTYKVALSEEDKKTSQLKAYANSSKPTPDDPVDDDKHVTVRCKKVLDIEVVSALIACCKPGTSISNTVLIVFILLALSREQKHRARMAQQGAIKLLLQVRDRASKTEKAGPEASIISHSAAHALARLLISVNPAHVFSSAIPASSAVSALASLLLPEGRDLLPTFEALLALTNLASMEDSTARDLIIRSILPELDELLFSPSIPVQRASVELVCNIMASPACAAKFADGSTDAKRRLQILLALTDTEDLGTRRAAGGALAMLTEWDAGVTAVLDAKEGRGVKAVMGMCEDESEQVRHRGFVCLGNVVGAPDEVGRRGVQAVKDAEGLERVKKALTWPDNGVEVLSIGLEVLKKLV